MMKRLFVSLIFVSFVFIAEPLRDGRFNKAERIDVAKERVDL